MKAVFIDDVGKVNYREVTKPEPHKGWVRVKVKAACVCATDIEVIDGKIPAKYPIIPGHEWSGIVEAVGSEEDAHWISKRVVASNDICCLKCQACRSGEWRNCKEFREIGFFQNGAYAEYIVVPAYALYELPDTISYVQGALIEPLGVGLAVVEKSNLKIGDTVTVIGAGSVGLNVIMIAKAMGAGRIIASAYTGRRLKIAEKIGAYITVATSEEDLLEVVRKEHFGGSDIIYETSGAMECYLAALNLVKKSGAVVLAGYGRQKEVSFVPDKIHINNLKIIGAGNNWNTVFRCINLLNYGIVNTEFMATHIFSLEDYHKAIEMTRNRPDGFIKAVFTDS